MGKVSPSVGEYLLHKCKGGHNLTCGNTVTTDEGWGGEKPLGGL